MVSVLAHRAEPELPDPDLLTEPASRWEARLSLRLRRTARGTRLIERYHHGPLYVQSPFYPEGADLAHLYILHPPGGLVTGDCLDIAIRSERDCLSLFTTPGAGRVYRAREDHHWQQQSNQLQLDERSHCEWLPLESIIFPGARARLTTRVDLAQHSSFIGWEITCLGLPASHSLFNRGELNQTFSLYRQGKLVIREKQLLQADYPDCFTHEAGLQNHSVLGFMLAGPFENPEQLEQITTELRQLSEEFAGRIGVTVVEDFILIRSLNDCGTRTRLHLTECWQLLRPALTGRPACHPRIWNC